MLDLQIFFLHRKHSIPDEVDLCDASTKRIVDNTQHTRVHVVRMFDLHPGMISKYAQCNGTDMDFVRRGLDVLFR